MIIGSMEERNEMIDEIARLRTELEDVRQQRETLKAECAVLSYELKIKQGALENALMQRDAVIGECGQFSQDIDKLRTELEDVRRQRETVVMEAEALGHAVQKLRAEVERRGQMLERCLPALMQHRQHHTWVRNLVTEIESLGTAPATSTTSTGADDE